MQDVKTVYYSPSGLLHKVSFAAICKEQDVFLSDVYNFRQMGSTGNLAFEKNTQFGELENFLLMGGVKYQSEKENESEKTKEVWSYLPGSLAETNTINTYLQKKKFGVNYFNGSNASEEIFKEKISSSSIVHIATHGFFFPDPEQLKEEMKTNSEQAEDEIKFRGTTNYANWSFVNNKNPLMRSGIVLANANDVWQRDPLAEGEDGILTAQEVSNLDLRNTKLVVLSACETGLGDIKGSEGVFGLQRAFKMAGVKYLIMSLWQVPDKETSEFMILFYKNLIKEKDIPVAFQKTQKAIREKYDPYYWGAFVLIE
ncbi:MAG: CHAT domain-containing protein [Crocinitomicaceae bacterium]|nr:CHAT domain-containing protein [Crocinitomicaceae bacterium]